MGMVPAGPNVVREGVMQSPERTKGRRQKYMAAL